MIRRNGQDPISSGRFAGVFPRGAKTSLRGLLRQPYLRQKQHTRILIAGAMFVASYEKVLFHYQYMTRSNNHGTEWELHNQILRVQVQHRHKYLIFFRFTLTKTRREVGLTSPDRVQQLVRQHLQIANSGDVVSLEKGHQSPHQPTLQLFRSDKRFRFPGYSETRHPLA